MNKYLSCATCVYSHFAVISNTGFEIINGGCNNCRNYDEYEHDELTIKERFKQEKED